ncbi:MAG TPA: NAD(P)H-dependent oxidoreductase [Gammaproteobacteria bacterium]|nr:NAD(P)H-dependent oxidoreductase [Gammaproteobacteria bacterium]
MSKHIAIIDSHPDQDAGRLGHDLANAYADGAREAGHEVHLIRLADLDFPLIRSKQQWDSGKIPPALEQAQDSIAWADHLVILYPLWLGSMPALLKAFLEQVMRPGFAIATPEMGGMSRKLLRGKSARLVVTMGMPAALYRWYFRAHSLKSLERNILKFCGVTPVKETLIGMVENMPAPSYRRWMVRLAALGSAGT